LELTRGKRRRKHKGIRQENDGRLEFHCDSVLECACDKSCMDEVQGGDDFTLDKAIEMTANQLHISVCSGIASNRENLTWYDFFAV
jgi:hypothetical protein